MYSFRSQFRQSWGLGVGARQSQLLTKAGWTIDPLNNLGTMIEESNRSKVPSNKSGLLALKLTVQLDRSSQSGQPGR